MFPIDRLDEINQQLSDLLGLNPQVENEPKIDSLVTDGKSAEPKENQEQRVNFSFEPSSPFKPSHPDNRNWKVDVLDTAVNKVANTAEAAMLGGAAAYAIVKNNDGRRAFLKATGALGAGLVLPGGNSSNMRPLPENDPTPEPRPKMETKTNGSIEFTSYQPIDLSSTLPLNNSEKMPRISELTAGLKTLYYGDKSTLDRLKDKFSLNAQNASYVNVVSNDPNQKPFKFEMAQVYLGQIEYVGDPILGQNDIFLTTWIDKEGLVNGGVTILVDRLVDDERKVTLNLIPLGGSQPDYNNPFIEVVLKKKEKQPTLVLHSAETQSKIELPFNQYDEQHPLLDYLKDFIMPSMVLASGKPDILGKVSAVPTVAPPTAVPAETPTPPPTADVAGSGVIPTSTVIAEAPGATATAQPGDGPSDGLAIAADAGDAANNQQESPEAKLQRVLTNRLETAAREGGFDFGNGEFLYVDVDGIQMIIPSAPDGKNAFPEGSLLPASTLKKYIESRRDIKNKLDNTPSRQF